MRMAERQTGEKDESRQLVLHDSSKNAPIVDHSGHISLFQAPTKSAAAHKAEKHPEVEATTARKKKEQEDQYTMRFSNAAGRGSDIINSKSWYQTSKAIGADASDTVVEVGKDVWGNEDPLRKSREAKRIVDSDPLAFMKRGAAQMRQVDRERKKWKEEKDREIKELEEEDRRRRRKERRERRSRGNEREHRYRVDEDEHGLEALRLEKDQRRRKDGRDEETERQPRDVESEHSLDDFRLDQVNGDSGNYENKRKRYSRRDSRHRGESRRNRHSSDKERGSRHTQTQRESRRHGEERYE